MVKTTDRACLIKELKEFICERHKFKLFRTRMKMESSFEDKVDKFFQYYLLCVLSQKYVYDRPKIRKVRYAFVEDLISSPNSNGTVLPWLTDTEFKQKYRMTRISFHQLVNLIKDDPVFQRTYNKGNGQAPVEHQLMVLLKYLGTQGNGANNEHIRQLFKIGSGTADLFKMRAMHAIRNLRSQVVYWPDETEREIIAKRIQKKYLFPNCVGFIDGTLFPLYSKPQSTDAPDYFGRKHCYSLSVLIVNDDNKIIRYYLSGWPGSAHDNRIFNNSQLVLKPHDYFSKQQYLLGDSAYENHWFMVSSYKCHKGMTLSRPEETFNTALARPRITAEHTIGMLKGRFPWLRNIRMIIKDDPESLKKILKFIDVCIILHNLLTQNNDPVLSSWNDDNDFDKDENNLEDYSELNEAIPSTADKAERRRQLTIFINETYIP
jgi:DDE superfamily endonuclease